jgi:hypothetical protein
MTLPVRGSELVISKLVVSTMWIVLTGIVSMLGILIFVWNTAPMADVIPVLMKVLHYLDAKEYLAIALIFIAVVATILKEIAKLFLSCSIAHLKLLGRFRIPLGILSYFVLSWLEVKVIEAVSLIAGSLPMFNEYMQELKFDTQCEPSEDIFQVTGLFNMGMRSGSFTPLYRRGFQCRIGWCETTSSSLIKRPIQIIQSYAFGSVSFFYDGRSDRCMRTMKST